MQSPERVEVEMGMVFDCWEVEDDYGGPWKVFLQGCVKFGECFFCSEG